MPEIGEVARVVHYLRKHLVNKTLTKVTANVDEIVYGKVGTSAAEFEKHMKGKKVVDVGQQGKYFWMIMSSPPHPVMHLGMSGWFKFQSEHTYYYRKKDREAADEWPPKYAKFIIKAEGGGDSQEAAFVDARRLARIRLVDCDGKEIRKQTPLKENGPDPVIDKDLVTLEWLTEKCIKKKVPIKAMLLDQANISGIGNWVGDEIMYNAKIHPEQYANTLQDNQIKQLHKSIHYVCGLAVDVLADSEQFPEDWLFKHRWGKGKKAGGNTLPNGDKIIFLTVGGRTSAVIPAVQKKTGPVAKEVSEGESDVAEEEKPTPKSKTAKGRKRKIEEDDDESSDEVENDSKPPPKKAAAKKGKSTKAKAEAGESPKVNGTEAKKSTKRGKKTEEVVGTEVVEDEKPKKLASRGKKTKVVKEEQEPEVEEQVQPAKAAKKISTSKSNGKDNEVKEETDGRRRSGRLRK